MLLVFAERSALLREPSTRGVTSPIDLDLHTGARGYRCWPLPPAGEGATPPVAPPTSCVRRWGGCATRGQLTVRADSGF